MASKIPRAGSLEENWFSAIFIGASQKLNISASSVESSPVAIVPTNTGVIGTTVVRLYASKDCYIAIGENPTATVNDLFLPAGIIEYFGITPGHKIAVIRATGNGTLYITEGAPT